MKTLLGSLVIGSALLLGACGNEEQVSKEEPTKEEPQVETKVDDPNVPWWEEEGGQEKLEEVPYEKNGATVESDEEEWIDPNAEQAEEELLEAKGGSYGYAEGEYDRWKEGVYRQVEENREKERKFQEKGYYE